MSGVFSGALARLSLLVVIVMPLASVIPSRTLMLAPEEVNDDPARRHGCTC